MNKKNQLRYNAWTDYLSNTRDRANYSIRRMDLLIITICGAGIYLIFETLREYKLGNIQFENRTLLFISGSFFLVAIISNFISQKTGFFSNNNEEKYIQIELKKILKEDIDNCIQKELDKKVIRYNKITNILNIISITFMLIALILLAVFNFILFY
jgi:hypothetical protein